MEMDRRWDAFAIPRSFAGFCDDKHALPEIRFKPEVNADVLGKFRVIRKLLEHSYYEYEFYDVAAVNALLAFEMALKIRYREVTRKRWNGTLEKLLAWFNAGKYFEVYNEGFLDYIRHLRNDSAHPTTHHFAGPMKRHFIEHSVNLINDVYEDPQLRAQRMDLMEQIGNKLIELNKSGLKVAFKDSSFQLAYVARPVFINNKLSPREIYISYTPIFEIPDTLVSGHLCDSPSMIISANSVELFDDMLTLHDKEFGSVHISPIHEPNELETMSSWGSRFIEYNRLTAHMASINLDDNLLFLEYLKQFHFTI